MPLLNTQANNMALDAVVYPHQEPLKDFYNSANWGYDCFPQQNENEQESNYGVLFGNYWENLDNSASSIIPNSSPETCTAGDGMQHSAAGETASNARRKRRRIRSCKNKEELENQRMTHIAVERNRRKQMNEYLATIRSLMPPSYAQRGDQASIVGGAINFVKELEQQLQTMEAKKRSENNNNAEKKLSSSSSSSSSQVFGDVFTYPQYTMSSSNRCSDQSSTETVKEGYGEIEVSMVESHASLKIMTKKRPKQLIKIVGGLQCFSLTILHLNVTTIHHMILYTISLKLEEGCQMTTVEEIADLVNHLLGRIEEESALIS
jgi:myogenic factor 6